MLLWICFAILTAAVVLYVLQPLRGEGSTMALDPTAADATVYRDQLRELEGERERGLVSTEEFESARAEIARRLLAVGASNEGGNTGARQSPDLKPHKTSFGKKLTYGLAGFIPLVSIAAYVTTGSPDLPAQPFAARIAKPVVDQSIVEVITRIERQLAEHPEDGKGWEVIAPVYLRLGRYGDAAHAFAEANRILGEKTKFLIGFSQSTIMAENGIVTDPVRKAALRVLELEPDRKEPKVWLALAKEQDGDLKGAEADYRMLLENMSEGPWRTAVAERIDLVGKKMRGEPVDEAPKPDDKQTAQTPPQGLPPGAGEVQKMAPAEQQAFINQMVTGLAERLKTNGRDLEGWLKLMRAYTVLGRTADAKTVVEDAKKNFPADQKSLDAIANAARELGLGT